MAKLRVATFNVKRLSRAAVGRGEAIGDFLAALGTDVVALQEVDDSAAERIATRIGFPHCTFVGHAPSGRRGVALVHRHAAVSTEGARIAARPGDDKGFTRAVLATDGGVVDVVGVHLDWISRQARERQIAELAARLPPSPRRVVMGDFNAMNVVTVAQRRPHDDTASAVARALGLRAPAVPKPTFPSGAPRWALDWIVTSDDLALGELRVHPSKLSDHAALVAEVFDAAA